MGKGVGRSATGAGTTSPRWFFILKLYLDAVLAIVKAKWFSSFELASALIPAKVAIIKELKKLPVVHPVRGALEDYGAHRLAVFVKYCCTVNAYFDQELYSASSFTSPLYNF